MTNWTKDQFLISYMNLRRVVGALGMALPWVVMIGGRLFGAEEVQDSVSAYYYTNMQDFFVGLLCMTGLFLISYKGFDWIDDWATNFSGACALGVAAFPTNCETLHGLVCQGTTRVGTFGLSSAVSSRIHIACAALLFVSLALISLLLFTKTDQALLRPEKKLRNAIYRACGWGMLAAMAFFAVLHLPFVVRFTPSRLILYVEIVCLTLFGVSWLTKGEIPPLADKAPAPGLVHGIG